jgi:autotransporter family porin
VRLPRILLAIVIVTTGAASGGVAAARLGHDDAPGAPASAASQIVAASAVTAGGMTATGAARPASAAAGTRVVLAASVADPGGQAVLVDLEVYDRGGRRVFQRFWDRQRLTPRTRVFRTVWTVPAGTRPGAFTVKLGVFTPGWQKLLRWNDTATRVTVRAGGAPATTIPTTTTTTRPPATAPPGAAPARFRTLPPGSALPSSATCAAQVRSRPEPESKGSNAAANRRTGHGLGAGFFDPGATDPRAGRDIRPRVDGAFTGTTKEILRWAACKWGIDEDLVFAQAAIESWWRQDTEGDFGSTAANCAPGHGIGADGRAGQCPESFGILQNRFPFERSAWPGAEQSTAMNADTAYAIWRACYEGYERWLNDVDRGRQYAAGDAEGCQGRWFAGRWHTAAADEYIARVRDYLDRRIWETPEFQEP